MKYGANYIVKTLKDDFNKEIENKIKEVKYDLEDSIIESPSGLTRRQSKIGFLKNDNDFLQKFISLANEINKECEWDWEIDAIEPLQYSEYTKGHEYDWHVDQHAKPYDDGRIRKMSFTYFINDTFSGGDFDIEIGHPNQEKDQRYNTIEAKKGYIVFFQSDLYHRVRPIIKGKRKSLVGWILGPKFK